MTDETAPATAPPAIDRTLIARDLGLLAVLIAPAIEARLTFLQEIPVVGTMLYNRLQGSPASMTSAALSSVLDLTDDELVVLIDTVGVELGAWRGFNPPVGPELVDAASAPYASLVAALDRR